MYVRVFYFFFFIPFGDFFVRTHDGRWVGGGEAIVKGRRGGRASGRCKRSEEIRKNETGRDKWWGGGGRARGAKERKRPCGESNGIRLKIASVVGPRCYLFLLRGHPSVHPSVSITRQWPSANVSVYVIRPSGSSGYWPRPPFTYTRV